MSHIKFPLFFFFFCLCVRTMTHKVEFCIFILIGFLFCLESDVPRFLNNNRCKSLKFSETSSNCKNRLLSFQGMHDFFFFFFFILIGYLVFTHSIP